MATVITLLTDFGDQDGYVGIVKGVITSICPAATIIDITHGIAPQNIAAARFVLLNAYGYFPQDAIHTVVIDPGVGTPRRAVAIQTPVGYFVGPDNGILSGVSDQCGVLAAISLTNAEYWLTPTPSATFHGRDIFAPAAAHLAAGVPLSELGEEIAPASLMRIAIPAPTLDTTPKLCHVQHVDYFGNIITTLPNHVTAQRNWRLQIGPVEIPLKAAYGEVEIGHAVALAGSHGWVEIAVNGSSAQQRFRLAIGDPIQLIEHYPG